LLSIALLGLSSAKSIGKKAEAAASRSMLEFFEALNFASFANSVQSLASLLGEMELGNKSVKT
jgi:hypothetical protein